MKKILQRYLPDHERVCGHRWLAPFANSLLHPRLWHLNRHSVAGAVAVGLACGLIPGPFQMPSAALVCVLVRVNLPLAVVTTLYTNPLTIVPLYAVAFALGSFLTGGGLNGFTPPPERGTDGLLAWMGALLDWLVGLGIPLAVGLPALAAILAPLGYLLVRAAWRMHVLARWRRRPHRHGG